MSTKNKQITKEIIGAWLSDCNGSDDDGKVLNVNEEELLLLADLITAALDAKTVRISDEEILEESFQYWRKLRGLEDDVQLSFEDGAKWARSKYEGEVK